MERSDLVWQAHLSGAQDSADSFASVRAVFDQYWDTHSEFVRLLNAKFLLDWEPLQAGVDATLSDEANLAAVLQMCAGPDEFERYYSAPDSVRDSGVGAPLAHVVRAAHGYEGWIQQERQEVDAFASSPVEGWEGEHREEVWYQRDVLDSDVSLVGFGALVATVVFLLERAVRDLEPDYKPPQGKAFLRHYFEFHPELEVVPSLVERVARLAKVRNCFAHRAGYLPSASEREAWQSLNPGRVVANRTQLLFDHHSVEVALEVAGRLSECLDDLV